MKVCSLNWGKIMIFCVKIKIKIKNFKKVCLRKLSNKR